MVEHQQVAELDKCVLFYGLTKTTATIIASGRMFLRWKRLACLEVLYYGATSFKLDNVGEIPSYKYTSNRNNHNAHPSAKWPFDLFWLYDFF